MIAEERRRRIRLSLAALAYERNYPVQVMTDEEFDREAKLIRPRVATGNPKMDWFFARHFQPHTGIWIHRHPEIDKLEQIYVRVFMPQAANRRKKRNRRRRKNRNR